MSRNYIFHNPFSGAIDYRGEKGMLDGVIVEKNHAKDLRGSDESSKTMRKIRAAAMSIKPESLLRHGALGFVKTFSKRESHYFFDYR